uniref:Uncharacterized protein n=1 Tax=Anguilla anguilla TaxID=7936 RepID=A0A0E9PAZ1_ANGAN
MFRHLTGAPVHNELQMCMHTGLGSEKS